MNAAYLSPRVTIRLQKELRPLWMIALATVAATYAVTFTVSKDAAFLVHFIGCVFVAAASFGHEFENHTHGLLMAQPYSRAGIWREKMLALAVILAVSWMVMIPIRNRLGNQWIWLSLYPPFLAACLAPYFTLLARTLLGGAVFSISASLMLLLSVLLGSEWYQPNWRNNQLGNSSTFNASVIGLLIFFGLITARLGFLRFKHLTVTSNNVSLHNLDLKKVGRWFDRVAKAPKLGFSPAPSRPWRLLVQKELRLHTFSFVMAGLLLVSTITFVLGRLAYPKLDEAILIGILFIYAFIFAAVTGASSVTEERALGMHESQLTLPYSPAKLFQLKVTVALGLSLFLGAFLPMALGAICHRILHIYGQDQFGWKFLAFSVCFSLRMTIVGIFASAISLTTLRAVILTVILSVTSMISPLLQFGSGWFTVLLGILLTAILFRTILRLAYRYYFYPLPGRTAAGLRIAEVWLLAWLSWLSITAFVNSMMHP